MTEPNKKALLIGINYRGSSHALHGCINDANNVRNMLLGKGYKLEDIFMLTDDTPTKPTRENILSALNALIASGAKTLFFHYSGHGTQLPDQNGDERDGKDEAICPIDMLMIRDDDIRAILVKAKPEQNIFCVIDACHSGTAADLGYNIVRRKGSLTFARDNKYPDTPANIVMVSGCMDSQYSADAFINRQSQGALTYAFLFSIQYGQVQRLNELYNSIHKIIKRGRYRQYPHMSSGRYIHVATPIFF